MELNCFIFFVIIFGIIMFLLSNGKENFKSDLPYYLNQNESTPMECYSHPCGYMTPLHNLI